MLRWGGGRNLDKLVWTLTVIAGVLCHKFGGGEGWGQSIWRRSVASRGDRPINLMGWLWAEYGEKPYWHSEDKNTAFGRGS